MNRDLMKRVLQRMYDIRNSRSVVMDPTAKLVGILPRFFRFFGLCTNITNAFDEREESGEISVWLTETFNRLGFDSKYPVSHEYLSNNEAYALIDDLYIGEYGNRRWVLLNLLITEAEKFIKESGDSDSC